jgi:hypothetical protein
MLVSPGAGVSPAGRSFRVVGCSGVGYGAGVGVFKGKTKGETFALVASTLRPQ